MKSFLCAAVLVSLASFSFAQTAEPDPCAIISKAEVTKILGEIKEGPKSKEGLMKEKQCEWTNMSGSWLSVGVLSADKWGLKKMGANKPVDVQAMGEEAYSDKRGTDAELYVRKGKLMLEVRTSSGAEVAKKTAEIALKKMP